MQFLNTQEVMLKLNVTKMTVSRMVKEGRLTVINNDPHYLLFDAKVINNLDYKKHSHSINKAGKKRPVIVIKDGIQTECKSVAEASRFSGIKVQKIYNILYKKVAQLEIRFIFANN